MPLTWTNEEELKNKILRGLVPTAVADAGAPSNCGAGPRGGFETNQDLFISTGVSSNKIFRDAGERLNPATEIKLAPMNTRAPANEVYMVPGLKDNLFSAGKFVDAGHAWIFDQDEVGVYDKTNAKITTSRAAVMKGWHVPGKNVWNYPLQQADGAPLESKTLPQGLLRTQP